MTISSQLRTRSGYMSLKEVAAALGDHPQTLYKRLRKDPAAIPHFLDGVRLRFDPAQLADWIDSRQIG